jgi:hypothetical protein
MTGLAPAQANSLIAGLVVMTSNAVFVPRKTQNPSGFATADGSDARGLGACLQQPSEKNGLRQIMT